jgi:hypothetical protein
MLVDDIEGGPAEETVTFVWDGFRYDIDLNAKNVDTFRQAIAPYLEAARCVGRVGRGAGGKTAVRTRPASERVYFADLRAWARENGYRLSDRGRVPQQVKKAYEAARLVAQEVAQ